MHQKGMFEAETTTRDERVAQKRELREVLEVQTRLENLQNKLKLEIAYFSHILKAVHYTAKKLTV